MLIKNMKSKKSMALVGLICLALVSVIAIDRVGNDSVMIVGGEMEPIKATITEIDRENFTMKVEPLENSELLNSDITLDTKFTTFTSRGKESSINNFSAGYLVDVYVVKSDVSDDWAKPLRIEMNGGTSSTSMN